MLKRNFLGRIYVVLLQLKIPPRPEILRVLVLIVQDIADDLGRINLFGPLTPGEPPPMASIGPSAVRMCLFDLKWSLLRNDISSARSHAAAAMRELRNYGTLD